MSALNRNNRCGNVERGVGTRIRAQDAERRQFRDQIEEFRHFAQTLSSTLEGLLARTDFLDRTNVMSLERGIDFYDEIRRREIALIQRALRLAGSQTGAAALLKLNLTTLNTKIKRYGLAARRSTPTSDRIRIAS